MNRIIIIVLTLASLSSLYAIEVDRQVLPSASVQIDHPLQPFLHASFIYWKCNSNLIYYQDGSNRSSGTEDIRTQGEYGTVNWGTHPGFKVGGGLNLPHGNWGVGATYTYLRTHDQGSSRATNIEFARPEGNWVSEPGGARVYSGKIHFTVYVHELDLELTRDTALSSSLSFKPIVGLKGFHLHHKSHVRYFFYDKDKDRFEYNISNKKTRSPGFGIRAGMETNWKVISPFSIYGRLAFTAAWVFHDSKSIGYKDFTEPYPNVGSGITYLKQRYKDNMQGLISEFGIGVRGERFFAENRYRLSFEIGYEAQIWDSVLMEILKVNGPEFDSFSLSGLTATTRFDF